MHKEKINSVGLRRLSFIVLLVVLQLATYKSSAQYAKLFDFGSTLNGASPYGSIITDGTYLYGMTYDGGVNSYGTIYKVKSDGTGFTRLLDFDGTNGGNPYGSLYFDGTFLYGMATYGGANNSGTIFKLKPDGTSFTKLFDFSYSTSGAYPYGSLISDGTFLYGMAQSGGSGGYGTVFKIKPDGTGFTLLQSFSNTSTSKSPTGSLYLMGTTLYGMTPYGGSSGQGNIFQLNTDGTGYVDNFDFVKDSGSGIYPYASLISDGTYLYGTTSQDGGFNVGTLFKILPNGSSFSVIQDFNTTSPGGLPRGSLLYDGTYLYCSTTNYGANGNGTIFKIKTDGTGLVNLLDNDIADPNTYADGTLILSGSTLYGVRMGGGGSGSPPFYPGTIFKINSDGSNYTKLFYFEAEGGNPNGSLYSDGTFFYGMTYVGGLYNYGTIYKILTNGTGYTELYSFDGVNGGQNPNGFLISDGTYLYGMSVQGGANGYGTIFKIKPDGTSFTKLWDLDQVNSGSYPNGSLFYDGTFLYGMTNQGGAQGNGVLFKITPTGTYTKLFDFTLNTSGGYPSGSLISDGTSLYGTTSSGGSASNGTIFKINTDGSGFAVLLNLDGTNYGSVPQGDLFYDGTFLYALTTNGGTNNAGVIVKVKTDASGATKLLDFDQTNGGNPTGSLISDGTYLYGMTNDGGYNGYGTLFKIKPDGSSYARLFDFNDGQYPQSSLVKIGSLLYGTTESGGAHGEGILFQSTTTPFTSINDFTPSTGMIGTYVTINGINFDPTPANNTVKFNGVTAQVISSTATTIVAVVPSGATNGTITVAANGTTGISSTIFAVTTQTQMTDGTIQACNVGFDSPNDTNDHVETFVPLNAGDKIKVSFSSFSAGDILNVYDGPSTASPQVASLTGNTLPSDIIATGSTGELTFEFLWQDSFSTTWNATITCVAVAAPPVINSAQVVTQIGGTANLNLLSLITTSRNNLDTTSLQVTVQPIHGFASITKGQLTIDYSGTSFVGKDTLTFKACDTNGNCASQKIYIVVTGPPPTIASTKLTTSIGGSASVNLLSLITTKSSIDTTSVQVTVQPVHGTASISKGQLTIDYNGSSYAGKDSLTFKACDNTGACATQEIYIDVVGDITVYNGISPFGKNPSLVIENINVLPDTKVNSVYIFDRWENLVWHGSNYDNSSVKFIGANDNGYDLPTGVYFYRIEFASGRKTKTGFISLHRQ